MLGFIRFFSVLSVFSVDSVSTDVVFKCVSTQAKPLK